MNRLLSIVSLPAACAAALIAAQPARGQWWAPSDGRPLPAYVEYANPSGRLGIVNASGPVETKGHPFFEALGTNGRACVSCHQPGDGMSLAVSSVMKRWHDTKGTDPIFAPIDGANCPNLPSARSRFAFVAARARALSDPDYVAARRCARASDHARIHTRGGPRSDRLQHGSLSMASPVNGTRCPSTAVRARRRTCATWRRRVSASRRSSARPARSPPSIPRRANPST